MRGLILAVQFLTRLPTPQVAEFRPDDLARSAVWFPLVGGVVGTCVALALAAGARVDPWFGGLAGLVVWVWVTGALHLDGLSDLADGLGAAHRDPERLLAVLRDPHVGSFGVIALVLQLATKLVLLALIARGSVALVALPLVAAWARYGAVAWSQLLPPLAAGSGERFGWSPRAGTLATWLGVLLAASAALAPWLALAAPVALGGWGLYLGRRLGGMTGDALGAGTELCESALLAVLVVAAHACV
ncbi:MAG: adenosylcobinamide-GDP ribazoletransferase [bacterium]|nr:adenosylcobinamide-GDP ribazoletransferase [bacterium]